MARHRKHKRRRHYGDGPASRDLSFGQVVGAVVIGTVAAQWVMSILPVTPGAMLPQGPTTPYGRLR